MKLRREHGAGGYQTVASLLLALVLVLAAFLQLTVVSKTVVDDPLQADAGVYLSYAHNLENFGVFSSDVDWVGERSTPPVPDKVRAPGYPAFLSAIGNPLPNQKFLRKVAFFQAAFGVASILLTYLIAKECVGARWALVPAVLATISPHITVLSTYILTESLFMLLLLGSILATIHAIRSGKLHPALLAGAIWAACSLVRPTTAAFPIVLAILTFVVPGLRPRARQSLALSLTCVAILALWAGRGFTVASEGPSLMINSIAHGSYPDFKFNDDPESFGFPYRFDPDYPRFSTDIRTLASELGARFAEQPLKHAKWYLAGKPYYFLSLEDVQSNDVLIYPTKSSPYFESIGFAILRSITVALHWPLMGLAALAAAMALWFPRALRLSEMQLLCARLIAALIIYAVVLHIVFAPFPRYAIPFRPLMYALALLPLHAAWKARRSRLRR